MTHQAPPSAVPSGADPGRQVAQLHELKRLVERIAGRTPAAQDAALDAAARTSAAYDRAPPIAQRRFDALAAESAAWAAAGVEALLAADGQTPLAAAGRLANALDETLSELSALLSSGA